MLAVFILVVLTQIWGTVAIGEIQVKLCHQHLSQAEYYIPKTKPCVKQQRLRTEKCKAHVYRPAEAFLKVKVFVCQTFTIEYQNTYYFFGAQVQDTRTKIDSPPHHGACADWVRTFVAPNIGQLEANGKDVWRTNNKVPKKFTWPRNVAGEVTNALLMKSIMEYDHVNHKINSALSVMSNCDIRKGFCYVNSKTYVWKVPDNLDCPRSKFLANDELLMHYNSSGRLYRLELVNLGISIQQWADCGTYSSLCYHPHSFCDFGGLMFVPFSCKGINDLEKFQTNTSQQTAFNSTRPESRYLNELNAVVQELAIQQSVDTLFLECQLQNLLAALYSITGRQFPSEVLSAIMGNSRAAITVGDVITEIVCEQINATLRHSLQYKSYFSIRPLVSFTDSNGTLRIGQVMKNDVVYEGVRLVEHYTPGRTFTFRVNDKFYLYDNYTLEHTDVHVRPIFPSLTPIEEPIRAYDFVSLSKQFPLSSMGLEDFNAILGSITQSQVTSEKINELLNEEVNETADADPTFVGKSVDKVAKHAFLIGLSAITNPIVNALVSALLTAAMYWGLILTLSTIKKRFFGRRKKNKNTDVLPKSEPDKPKPRTRYARRAKSPYVGRGLRKSNRQIPQIKSNNRRDIADHI